MQPACFALLVLSQQQLARSQTLRPQLRRPCRPPQRFRRTSSLRRTLATRRRSPSTTPSPSPTSTRAERSTAGFSAAVRTSHKTARIRQKETRPGNPTAHHPTAPIAPRLPGHVARPAEEGRSSKTWIDYSLFGHQMVCHFVSPTYRCVDYFNNVDADAVPVPHFGVVLSAEQFHALAARVEAAGVPFIVAPHLRFSGQPGEQWVRGLPRCTSGPPRVGGEARARLRPKRLSKTTASLLSRGDATRSLPRPFPLSPPADDVLQGPGGQQPRVQGNVHAR